MKKKAKPSRISGVTTKSLYEITFMVSLADTNPAIWRRLRLSSDMSLDDLHLAIQGAFGWMGSHMHQFTIGKGKTFSSVGISDGDGGPKPKDSKHVLLSSLVKEKQMHFSYEYDFGDSWIHLISIESVKPIKKSLSAPECVAGERCAPPEDCGGAPGFEEFKEIMANKKHPEYGEKKEWYGSNFIVDKFNLGQTNKRIKKFIAKAPPF
jgi:hypothetical protein